MAEFYMGGGIWMHPITLWGVAACIFMVLQLAKRDRDLRPMIWGAFAIMLLFGCLGVVVGMVEAFSAIAMAPESKRVDLLWRCLAIGFNPIAWALMLVALLAQLALPITWWARRHRDEGAQPADAARRAA